MIKGAFSGSYGFPAPPGSATRRDTPNAMWLHLKLDRAVAFLGQSARRADGNDPVPARPDRQRRHRRLGAIARDRRVVDLVPRDPFVEPPDIVGVRIAREWRAQGHHRAAPVRAAPAPARAQKPRPGSSRPAAPAADRRSRPSAPPAARSCRPSRPDSSRAPTGGPAIRPRPARGAIPSSSGRWR